MPTREELDTRQRFTGRYRENRTAVVEQIERAVIGGDLGANGYTTIGQADRLADALQLGPGDRLLDLGAGRVAAVASTARSLPFRAGSFDAVVHTDVLC